MSTFTMTSDNEDELLDYEQALSVIVGFPGIGRTLLSQYDVSDRFIDLDLPGLLTDPDGMDHYLTLIDVYTALGHVVLLPDDKDLRDILVEAGIEYTVVHPKLEHKSAYLERFEKNGQLDVLHELQATFEQRIRCLEEQEDCSRIYLQEGTDTLEHVFRSLGTVLEPPVMH